MLRHTTATLVALGLALPAVAGESPEGPEKGFETHPENGKQPAWTLGSGRTLWLLPVGEVYPGYIADLHRPQTAVMAHFYPRPGIDGSTDVRTGLDIGGRFGLLRLDPASPGGRSWQLSVDASFNAQFDSNEKLDNIGWDGKYGLTLTTSSGGPLSFKVAVLHDSAHIGDEYAERTGRERIDYARGADRWPRGASRPRVARLRRRRVRILPPDRRAEAVASPGGARVHDAGLAARRTVLLVRGGRFLRHRGARLAAGHLGPDGSDHDLRRAPLAVRRSVHRRAAAAGRVLRGLRGLVHLRTLDRPVAGGRLAR